MPVEDGDIWVCTFTNIKYVVFVTGGGTVDRARNATWWSFGGNAGKLVDGVPTGQFNITIHGSATLCHYVVNGFTDNPGGNGANDVEFTATGDCGNITVTIWDNGNGTGKNKTPDKITVVTTSGPVTITITDRPLSGGNFTIHRPS